MNIRAREKPGFDMLKNFRGVKADLKRITGNHNRYYDCLGYHGFEKADKIPSIRQSLQILDELRAVFDELLSEVTSR
jgi:hypothetical protein